MGVAIQSPSVRACAMRCAMIFGTRESRQLLVMTSVSSTSATLSVTENLPDAPHQPKETFSFPKRQFGKTKVVKRACQASWFRSWSWLHYDETKDAVLCYLCWKAIYEKKITVRPGSSDDAL